MDKQNKVEMQQNESYHYVLLGFSTFKDVLKKLGDTMKFYRFENEGKANAKEIIYDVPNNLLSDAGIVISKQFEDGKVLFNVRKISWLPGALKRPSKKFNLGEFQHDEEPKDFSLDISSAIEHSFLTPFTVDLDSIVRQTIPKIEIKINADKVKIIGGTGFRAYIIYENVTYRDIKTNKTVERDDVTLQLSTLEEFAEENKKLLDIIETKVCELGKFNASRFEIAQKLLYPKDEEETEE